MTTADTAIEASVIRKLTWRFLPFLGLCYIVLYMDRLNIGVAALTMNADLGLSATAFGLAAGIYFWSYTVCEVPSNLVLAKVGARRWIPRIMITWGLVTIGTAFVQGAGSLSVARVLLGIAEAGFSPGALYFVTRWFPYRARARAMGWIITCICLSGVTAPISAHLLELDGLAGLAGWRWLFVITGIRQSSWVSCATACSGTGPPTRSGSPPRNARGSNGRWTPNTAATSSGTRCRSCAASPTCVSSCSAWCS